MWYTNNLHNHPYIHHVMHVNKYTLRLGAKRGTLASSSSVCSQELVRGHNFFFLVKYTMVSYFMNISIHQLFVVIDNTVLYMLNILYFFI